MDIWIQESLKKLSRWSFSPKLGLGRYAIMFLIVLNDYEASLVNFIKWNPHLMIELISYALLASRLENPADFTSS